MGKKEGENPSKNTPFSLYTVKLPLACGDSFDEKEKLGFPNVSKYICLFAGDLRPLLLSRSVTYP